MEPNTGLDEEALFRTAPRSNRGKEGRGYHLTSEGLYRETVTAMCVRNPNIRWGHTAYDATPNEYGRAVVLELSLPNAHPAERKDFTTSRDLSLYLKKMTIPSVRRVILLEGVARNYVEVLGSHFNMNPAFFANQKRPNSWDVIKDGYFIERTANLPSLNDPRTSFMMRYPELRSFPPYQDRHQLNVPYMKDIDGFRQVYIGRRPQELHPSAINTGGGFHNVAIFNRAASYWSRRYEGGGWDAILLLDPPPTRIVRTNHRGHIIAGPEFKHKLTHGGQQDFIPYPNGLDQSRRFVQKASNGPSRVSMLEDICFYFITHPEVFDPTGNDPTIATIFLKKMAATHWMHLVDYLNASAHNLEHQFSKNSSFDVFRTDTMEGWWGDIHLWHRRCVQYCEEANGILLALRIPLKSVLETEEYNPMNSREDFTHIYRRLLEIKSRFELLLNSATGLNAIAGNKEATAQNERYSRRAREESELSLQQARKSSILTALATVAAPLAVTSSIFSMSPEWAPGGEKFGYYWAITLPLVFFFGAFYFFFGLTVRNSRHREKGDLGDGVDDLEKGSLSRG
ncbi:hypothetical protein N431DRAFT_494540 [Stipitochalara longipes BDJ]|nr:hypothetical protein N431DRAFT_494540 [Stipitochalara longipes BDJ]